MEWKDNERKVLRAEGQKYINRKSNDVQTFMAVGE